MAASRAKWLAVFVLLGCVSTALAADDLAFCVTDAGGTARQPGPAGKHVALVVGNVTYRHVARLDTPTSDARLITDALRALGFTLRNPAAMRPRPPDPGGADDVSVPGAVGAALS